MHVMARKNVIVEWERRHGLLQPELVISNGHDLKCTAYEIKVVDRMAGAVKWSKHFRGWLSLATGSSLLHFPFDYHDLRIEIVSRNLDARHCVLALWSGMHSTEFQEDSNEWQLVGHRAELCAAKADGMQHSVMHVCIMVRRHYEWYLYNVLGFLFALELMSFGVYAMPYAGDEAVGGRSGSVMALVVALIGMRFVVTDGIPRVRYATFFDEYAIFSFALIIMSGIESLFMFSFSKGETPTFSMETCDLINLVTAMVIFIIFTAYHVASLARIKRTRREMETWKRQRIAVEVGSGGGVADSAVSTEQQRRASKLQRRMSARQQNNPDQKSSAPRPCVFGRGHT